MIHKDTIPVQEEGYSILMSSSYLDAERELDIVSAFHGRRTSGIVVIGSQIGEGYLQMRERFPLPIVLTNCRAYPYSISTDNLDGARQAVAHLIGLGHRRIAYISNRRSYRSDQERRAGYRRTLADSGLRGAEELLVNGDGTLRGGGAATRYLLSLPQPPSAIFCFNDVTALGVLGALREARRRVPADVSVVGFDDAEVAAYCSPPLTTVRQPTERMGERLMWMLLALIQGQEDVGPEVLPGELIVRRSTGPPPPALST